MRRTSLVLALVVVLAAGALGSGAFAQGSMPRSVTLGTNPAGTVYFALASGIAKVVSGGAGYQMVVQPHAGTSTMLPLVNSGEMEFGIQNGVDLWLAYRGPAHQIGGRNPFTHAPNVRLVMRGAPLMVGLLVRKDSPIKTVQDVKGKRFTGEYRAHLAVWYNMFGHLASGGLTWNDVKVVPVNTVNDGVDALMQGRADVTQHALNSAKVKEADAAIGVRHISDDCSAQGEARMKQGGARLLSARREARLDHRRRRGHLRHRLRYVFLRGQVRPRPRRRGGAEGGVGGRRPARADPSDVQGVDARSRGRRSTSRSRTIRARSASTRSATSGSRGWIRSSRSCSR